MALDLHGAWENMTVHHAPLYMKSQDPERGLSIVRIYFNWPTTSNQIWWTLLFFMFILFIYLIFNKRTWLWSNGWILAFHVIKCFLVCPVSDDRFYWMGTPAMELICQLSLLELKMLKPTKLDIIVRLFYLCCSYLTTCK